MAPNAWALGTLVAGVLFCGTARADVFVVTKTSDSNDGQCDADCSLREAVLAANVRPGFDVIELASGTHLLTLGQLPVVDDATLRPGAGSSSTIDGGASSRILVFGAGVVARVESLTLHDGDPGNFDGGAIRNLGDLTVVDSSFEDNHCGGNGGAIANESLLRVERSKFLDGGSGDFGGGIYGTPGSETTVVDSLFRSNNAEAGGAIGLSMAKLVVVRTSIVENTAFGGGGLWLKGPLPGSRIADSTISSNFALVGGGGILIEEPGEFAIEGCTITKNRITDVLGVEDGGFGGGIAVVGDPAVLDITMRDTYVAGNIADAGAFAGPDCFCYCLTAAFPFGIPVAQSLGYNAFPPGFSPPPPFGFSVVRDCTDRAPTDFVTSDPAVLALGPLSGTASPGHDLASTSPLVDAVPIGVCTSTVDQRGTTRGIDGDGDGTGGCDVGALERFVVSAPIPALPAAAWLLGPLALAAALLRAAPSARTRTTPSCPGTGSSVSSASPAVRAARRG